MEFLSADPPPTSIPPQRKSESGLGYQSQTYCMYIYRTRATFRIHEEAIADRTQPSESLLAPIGKQAARRQEDCDVTPLLLPDPRSELTLAKRWICLEGRAYLAGSGQQQLSYSCP